MLDITSVLLKDGYKVGHKFQYPQDTTLVYSNLTARGARIPDVEGIIAFGIQYFVQEYLQGHFERQFFSRPKAKVMAEYERRINNYLGPGAITFDHIEALHDLGYLPLQVKAVPEGTLVPFRVPMLTIRNTVPEFFWLTNMLETILSNVLWEPCTSATTAFQYRRNFDHFATKTGAPLAFVPWQGHDFSFRGVAGLEAASLSGAAHLLSFTGTDTIPAIDLLEQYYDADSDVELVGGSVPATEHSVMCMGEQVGEEETFRRLLHTYPAGILSVVSDTWDFWKVMTEYLPALHDEVMARDGKLVIRPDSGNPADIICGVHEDQWRVSTEAQRKGAIEILWDEFGGEVNAAGYRELDAHVGLIYGDSINLDRQVEILQRLADKRFASSNVVMGIGSYCVAPETPILCADLVWRQAESLVEGEEIIAFDENPEFASGRKAARRYRLASIISNEPTLKPCHRLFTDVGDPITASEDHPWLVWIKNRSPETMYRQAPTGMSRRDVLRNPGLGWKTTMELEPGDKIAFIGKPWVKDETFDGGWLSGMYDGEGSLSKSTGDLRIPAWKVNVSQNEGLILSRLRIELRDRGFDFYENVRECPQLVLTGGFLEVLRFLGTVRPTRLLEALPKVLAEMPALKQNYTYKWATVTAVERMETLPVASIQTSSGTFITSGYLSHNTYQFVTRDTYGFAMKATYGETLSRGGIEIFKDPKTDAGIKKSAKGLLRVDEVDGTLFLSEGVTWDEESGGVLQPVFVDGEAQNRQSLSQIRARVASYL